MQKTSTNGFTLIEVLVALAIFAVSITALSGAMRSSISNSSYLQNKTLAHWLASNRMVEMQAAGVFPPLGEKKDKVEFAGFEWTVETIVEKPADVIAMHMITISVGQQAGSDVNYFATLSGYLADVK